MLHATDIVLFSCAYVRVKILFSWPWVLSDLLNFGVEALADVFFDVLKLLLFGPRIVEDHLPDDLDRVPCLSNILNFFLGSVGDTWVRHGVSVISVSADFHVEGAVLNNEGTSPLDGLSHTQYVLSINLDTRDKVSSRVEVCVVGMAVLGGSHGVSIVLANVDHWKFPEGRHVGSFSKLALGGSSIAIHGNTEVLLS